AENRVCKDDDLWSIARRAPATRTWHFIDIEGRFAAGDDPDGYGLDPLAVGGHPGNSVLTHFDAGSYGRPRGIKEKAFEDAYSTDRPLAMTKGTDGRMRPFLPGASLRGPLRHALSRAHRARGTDVSDPNVSHDKPGQPGEIFGTIEQSARLLVRDAEVLDDGWQAVRMQHHAEDEFAAGPYGSAKFDATVLLEASFGWRMVLEGNNEIELAEWKAAVKSLLGDDADLTGLGTLGHLPVGGLKWRGAGWGRWCVEKIEQVDEQAEPGTAPSDTSDTVASRKDSGAASTDAAQSTYPNARAALDEVKRIVASLEVDLDIERDSVSEEELTFAEVAKAVKPGDHCVSWWVEPRANPADIGRPRPVCFGWGVPPTEDFALDEARVSFADGAWHAVRQRKGYRWVRLRETAKSDAAGKPISYAKTQLVALRSDIGRFGWDKGETFKTPKQHDRIKVTAYIRDGRTLGFRWEEV
ncbi:MAG: RAMP superfamily CRISPR-associated protein, partial [Hyphomicrobiaceae bacterium]